MGRSKPPASLRQVGRGQVDDRAARVAVVAEVDQGALDAMDALLDRHLGQADEDGLGQAGGGVDFHLDGDGVDADQGEGVQLGEHKTNHGLHGLHG